MLAVTHLPQVAAAADRHLVVSKALGDGGATESTLDVASGGARTAEVARMLGGERVSETTLAHAEEMLDSAAAGVEPANPAVAGTQMDLAGVGDAKPAGNGAAPRARRRA